MVISTLLPLPIMASVDFEALRANYTVHLLVVDRIVIVLPILQGLDYYLRGRRPRTSHLPQRLRGSRRVLQMLRVQPPKFYNSRKETWYRLGPGMLEIELRCYHLFSARIEILSSAWSGNGADQGKEMRTSCKRFSECSQYSN